VLDEVFGSMPIEAALSDVIVPYLRALELGAIRTAATVARIQFATSVIESQLLTMAGGWDAGGEPTLVLACPGWPRHPCEALAFGLVLQHRGWRIISADVDPSLEAAVHATERADADVLALVVRDPSVLADAPTPLAALDSRRLLLLTGAGANGDAAQHLHAQLLPEHPVLAAIELDRQLGRGD
jgi:hypothetical protein